MSAATMHFALGMLLGSALVMPGLLRAWRDGRPLAKPFLTWIMLAYGLGMFATLPAALCHAGLSAAVCEGWWMNVFLGYPLLNRIRPGGMKAGALLCGLVVMAQYGLLLLAVRRADRAPWRQAAR